MKREANTDPEVIADLQLRARSERDPSRGGEPYSFGDRATVEHWPCRRCGTAMVGVTDSAITALETSNRRLEARGERPIPKSAVVFCSSCEPIAKLERDARVRTEQAEIRALERELFSLIDNDLREASIADRLRQLGRHDVGALLADAKQRRIERARAATTTTKRNAL